MCWNTAHIICATLTWCVRGSQGAGSGVLVGFGVAGGERFGHGCGGMIGGVAGPAQCELQSRTLRETLKRRQTLQKQQTRGFTTQISCVNWGLLGSRTQTHTFPSRMVSQVALFLPTGHSSISCMDTSYSPSNNCRRLHASTRQRLLTSAAQTLQWHLFFPVPKGATVCARQCMCVSFTCFYQRLSSELQMWFLPPPWEQSSSFSCSQLLLKSLKKTHGDMNLCSAKPSLVFCTDVELRGWLCLIFKFKQLKKYRYR